ANGLTEFRDRITGGDLAGDVDDDNRIRSSCAQFEVHKIFSWRILTLFGYPIDNGFQNRIGIDTFSLAFEIQNDAVAQCRQDHMANVLASHSRTAAQQGPNLAADNQGLGSSRTGAVPQI